MAQAVIFNANGTLLNMYGQNVTVKTGFTFPVSAGRDPRVGIMILRMYLLIG